MAAFGWCWIKAAGETLLDLIYPPRCPFCGKILDQSLNGTPFRIVHTEDRRRAIVCGECAASLPWRENALRNFPGGFVCAGPLVYTGSVRESLLKFKFRGEISYAEPLGALVAQCAADRFSGEFDAVTWVPISRERRRKRGYDQAEELAKAAGRVWNVRPERFLMKTKNNPPQSSLDSAAERIRNAAGVYAIDGKNTDNSPVRGKRILLIDDICTTGATMLECRRVLLENGAAAVFGAVVAIPGSSQEEFS